MPSIQTTIARELNLTAAQVATVIDLIARGTPSRSSPATARKPPAASTTRHSAIWTIACLPAQPRSPQGRGAGRIPNHRTLAINLSEKGKKLRVKVRTDADAAIGQLERRILRGDDPIRVFAKNTGSLLGYVSGISVAAAKSIVAYREEYGAFTDRKQLKKVPKPVAKAFQNCAGFLRIFAKHPSEIAAVGDMIRRLGGVTGAEKDRGKTTLSTVKSKAHDRTRELSTRSMAETRTYS